MHNCGNRTNNPKPQANYLATALVGSPNLSTKTLFEADKIITRIFSYNRIDSYIGL